MYDFLPQFCINFLKLNYTLLQQCCRCAIFCIPNKLCDNTYWPSANLDRQQIAESDPVLMGRTERHNTQKKSVCASLCGRNTVALTSELNSKVKPSSDGTDSKNKKHSLKACPLSLSATIGHTILTHTPVVSLSHTHSALCLSVA